ncbi:MAG TPA: DUF559 domain-containing protein, partial [Solirubrobacteraceae bacterium]
DRQHAIVGHWQLVALGLGASAIQRRVRSGRLHPKHRGVYAVGTRKLTEPGRWMAAVLALGPKAVLSHREAAILHDLRGATTLGEVNVTVPGRTRRPRTGIRVHNVRTLHPEDRTTVNAVPVTSLHRTLLDYAETARPAELAAAFRRYDRSDRLDTRQLDAVIARNPGRRGIKPLRAVLAGYRGAPDSRSRNERRLYEAICATDLPVPQLNVMAHGECPDLWWPEHRLVVEVDGYRWHHTPADRAEDRRKQRILRKAGIEVLRISDDEIEENLDEAVNEVREALARRRRAPARAQ